MVNINLKYGDKDVHSDSAKIAFRIAELKKKIIDGTITPEEKEELLLLKY